MCPNTGIEDMEMNSMPQSTPQSVARAQGEPTQPGPKSPARIALFSGGGSGGHVFPGLAVAAELENRGWRVDWAGAEGAMEDKLVRRQGMPFHPLAARPMVGRGLAGKAVAVATLLGSAWSARRLVKRIQAEVVLGTGGYVSAPAVLGGRLARVPVLLLEPNAEAGFANRMLSRWSQEAALAHDATAEDLRCPTTTTGVPVRDEFFAVSPHLPFGAPLRILVLGGSQGAQRLNRTLPEALAKLPQELGQIVVRHQCGKRHTQATSEAYETQGFPVVQVEGGGFRPNGPRIQVEVASFLHDVAGAMAESHLIVSRAGAITLAEICAAGRPVLLVPLSLAAGHQEGNARRLKDAGAAEVLSDQDTPEAYAEMLADLLGNTNRLEKMAAAARRLGRPEAALDIADRLELWADRTRGGRSDV